MKINRKKFYNWMAALHGNIEPIFAGGFLGFILGFVIMLFFASKLGFEASLSSKLLKSYFVFSFCFFFISIGLLSNYIDYLYTNSLSYKVALFFYYFKSFDINMCFYQLRGLLKIDNFHLREVLDEIDSIVEKDERYHIMLLAIKSRFKDFELGKGNLTNE